MTIQVILGTTRRERFGDKPARWLMALLARQPDITAELLDLREYPLPFYDEPLTPSRLAGRYQDPAIQRWVDKIAEGDAYILITGEYNHGYPAVIKNALDYPYDQWHKKPITFVAYGNAGGARAVEQLRQVVIELQMAPIRQALHIPWSVYSEVIRQADPFDPNPFKSLGPAAQALIDQLSWWAGALKIARAADQAKTDKEVSRG